MNRNIEYIRGQLETERERLANLLADITGQPVNDARRQTTAFRNKDETASAYSDLEKRAVHVGTVREKLNEIDRALDKIANGTYGLCDNCGCSIPCERLAALPQTSLCLSCKSRQSRSSARIAVA